MLEGLDPTSPTWRAIESWANDQLIKQRLKNDGIALDERQTAVARGQIAALKAVLALKAPARSNPVEDSSPTGY